MANQQSAEQGLLVAQAVANSPPEARDVCLVAAQGAAIGVPAQASDPDGDARLDCRGIDSGERPGSMSIPDGTLTFVPDQPGLQRFTYEVTDGRGGTDTAQVMAFVNSAEGELERPVLQGLDDQQLARMARACASGQALDVERLEGPSITVPLPAPGERIEALAQPGQQIHLQSGEFISATYLIAEGGLLVLTEDGRMVYVAGLVDAANSAQPPTLRVAGGTGRGQRRAPYQSAAAHAACGGRGRRPSAVAADRPRALGRRQLQPLRSRRDRRRSVSPGPAPADRAGLGHAAPSRKSGAVRRRGEQRRGPRPAGAGGARERAAGIRRDEHDRARVGRYHRHPAVRIGRTVSRARRERASAGRPDQRRRSGQPDARPERRCHDRLRQRVRDFRQHAWRVPDRPERSDGRSEDRVPRDRAGRGRSELPITPPGRRPRRGRRCGGAQPAL